MSNVWLIDGSAFNSLRWRAFIHESLESLRVFCKDLNVEYVDDHHVGVRALKSADGGRSNDAVFLGDESHEAYETNRGALVAQSLAPDGFDDLVLETFELPLAERLERFDAYYKAVCAGDLRSVYPSWSMIPDTAKLIYTLHLWQRARKGKLSREVWSAVLYHSWPHGKVGSMLFRAGLSERQVLEMFSYSIPSILMSRDAVRAINSLPQLRVFRGASDTSRFKERGFSWTLDREQAEWFALTGAISGKPLLLEAVVPRGAILMYSPSEEEVVLNPSHRKESLQIHPLATKEKSARIDALRSTLRTRAEGPELLYELARAA